MFATIRSFHGVDQTRTTELTEKVNETLMPLLKELPGFAGYYLVDAGNGISPHSVSSRRVSRARRRRSSSARGSRTRSSTGCCERAEDHEWQGRRRVGERVLVA